MEARNLQKKLDLTGWRRNALNLLAVWNGAERVFLVRILPDRKNRRQFFSDPGIISASEKTETTVQSARQRENSLFIPSLFMNYSLIIY